MDMLEDYIFKAEEMIKYKDSDTFIILGCTHYSFVLSEIIQIAEMADIEDPSILDPAFIQAFLFLSGKEHYKNAAINHAVYSRVPLFEKGNDRILDGLELYSEKAFMAAMNYKHDPDLF